MNEPQASISHPSRDEFAALLEESLTGTALQEGSVIKGTIVAIEKDVAVIDVGLKTEGRIPLKEFGISGRAANLHVGDEVDVYLERVENSAGEAVLSREKARREESWTRLEEKYKAGERVEGVIFNRVKGGFTVDLDGAVAFLPGSQVDIRPIRDVGPLMNQPQPFQIVKIKLAVQSVAVVGFYAEFEKQLSAASFKFTPQGLLNGTTKLAYEIGENKSKGGESPYAGTSIADMYENVEGIEAVYNLVFRSALKARDAKLAARIHDKIEDVEAQVKGKDLKSVNQPALKKAGEELAVLLQSSAAKLKLKKPAVGG